MSRQKQNIPVVASWRGVLAMCIFMFHFGFKQEFCQLTWCGVVFFFVSSGFLVTLHHRGEKLTWRDSLPFWFRRAVKLYPAHWLAMLLFVLLAVRGGTFVAKLWPMTVNLLLLQTFVPVQECFFSYNVLSWFLSALLLCYAVYPLLARFWSQTKLGTLWCIVAVLLCVNVAAIHFAVAEEAKNYLYVCPLARLGEFALGMTLGETWARTGFKASASGARWLELGAWVSLVAFIVIHRRFSDAHEWYDATVLWWIPAGALMWTMAACNGAEGPVGKLLLTKPLRFLGKISFELYLYQAIAPMALSVTLLPLVYHYTGVTLGYHNAWFVATSVLCQIALSWGLHKWVVRPYWQWCSRRGEAVQKV